MVHIAALEQYLF